MLSGAAGYGTFFFLCMFYSLGQDLDMCLTVHLYCCVGVKHVKMKPYEEQQMQRQSAPDTEQPSLIC